MTKALIAAALLGLALSAAAPRAEAAQQKGAHYNCQNGPQMTVIFTNNNGQISARYVYDGPQSAMKVMLQSTKNQNLFANNRDSMRLSNRGKTIDYREGADFSDRCTAFSFF